MHLVRLRLTGFKSFADKVELVLEPGLTGIVGPNGCGKSNLIEALRWVMGESSARRLRGGDMDDVIFNGTTGMALAGGRRAPGRAARSLAEVVAVIDNEERRAPAPFNQTDTIEIVRRIERGQGSDFRINAKAARARDVQLLFADAGTGAGSPALVGQGRVAQLIAAKPFERRQVLEDAAGIAGLAGRRAESEQRLRATETNLGRLDDVLATLGTQAGQLRRQARQAERWQGLTRRIDALEAAVLVAEAEAETDRLAGAETGFHEAEAAVRLYLVQVGEATAEAGRRTGAVTPAREAERAASEVLGSAKADLARIEAEAKAATETATRRQRAEAELQRDARDAQEGLEEAERSRARLAEEATSLAVHSEEAAPRAAEAQGLVAAARATLATAEAAAHAATVAEANQAAARQALIRQRDQSRQRLGDRERRLGVAANELKQIERPDPAIGERLDQAIQAAEQAVEAARGEVRRVEQAAEQAQQTARGARAAALEADQARARLAAEREGLRALLPKRQAGGQAAAIPLATTLTAAPGQEAALAAALGDLAEASEAIAAPRHLEALPPSTELTPPAGSARLAAPALLARALGGAGLVDRLPASARDLTPGQLLVTREGAVLRWDGLHAAPGSAGAQTAERMRLANRLTALEPQLAAAEAAAGVADQARRAAEAAERAAAIAIPAARAAERERATQLDRARAGRAAERERVGLAAVRQAAAERTLDTLTQERDAEQAALARLEAELEALPPATATGNAATAARHEVQAARARLTAAEQEAQRLAREDDLRQRRLAQIGQERTAAEARLARARERLAEIDRRVRALAEEARLAALAPSPEMSREEALGRLAQAQRVQAQTAAARAEADAAAANAERALRAIERALADAREARARAEAALSGARERLEAIRGRAQERFGRDPAQVLALIEGADLPPPAERSQRLRQLIDERAGIGAVNLRAQEELTALEADIARLEGEKADLAAAVAKLRQGIGALNREARERLNQSFGIIDRHFRALFRRLFGGGEARLELIDAEDPLEAGLEIVASPPGKKLAQLSLLSGGEQALTATALIFAMFLTNPAPLCVLDEVDAPLDDANVDRFCSLIQEIAAETGTRFLVVTHHRLTMARMDRLYGVTMAERGISRLVAVDLSEAERMVPDPVEEPAGGPAPRAA